MGTEKKVTINGKGENDAQSARRLSGEKAHASPGPSIDRPTHRHRSSVRTTGGTLVAAPTAPASARPPAPAPAPKPLTASQKNRLQRKSAARRRPPPLPPVERHPWERQAGESPEAYRYFSIYRDMDPCQRSGLEIQKLTGLNLEGIGQHRTIGRWVERAAAWDFHLERCRLQSTEAYQVEMAARHAAIAQKMLTKVESRLLSVDLLSLGPKDIAAWLEVGTKVERLARGLSSDASAAISINAQINTQINHLSDAQILAEIAREGRRGGTNFTGGPSPDLIEAASKASE